MNEKYISVADAMSLTGATQAKITRLCRKYLSTNHVHKTANKYYISEQFLIDSFAPEDKIINLISQNQDEPKEGINTAPQESEITKELREQIKFLQGQISVKDKQIEEKDSQIKDLTESTKGAMFLLKDMQNKLSAPVPTKEETTIIHHEPEPKQKKRNKPQSKKDTSEAKQITIDLFNSGLGDAAIAKELNNRGLTNLQNKPFSRTGVFSVLKRAGLK